MAPESPRLSVDVVPVYTDNGHLHVVVGKRAFAPYKGKYALPGVLIIAGETLQEAALRALRTKVGAGVMSDHPLRRFGIYDQAARDKRGPTFSVGDVAVIDPDILDPNVAATKSMPVADAVGLPFDHDLIITGAVGYLASHLWDDDDIPGRAVPQTIAQDLLGDEFTTTQMVNLLGDIDPSFNTTNTSRLLKSQKVLARAGGGKSTGGRAPTLWRFKGV